MTEAKKIKKAGMQKLNGVQVVTYCRIRKNDGDEQRAERYRAAMAAALKKARGMELKDIDKTADTVLPQITTNIPAKEIRDLMIKYYDLKIDESVGWPYTWDGVQLNGVWYDAPITLSSNDKDLHKDIFGSKKYEPSQTVQNINQLIIDETGFDENSPVQITNKKKKK